jgi:hypothetical protein
VPRVVLRAPAAKLEGGKGLARLCPVWVNEGHLSQMWFAGNHSDIGGSYSETESRLSDISLQWMIEETQKLPFPLKLGPVTVNGRKIEGTGTDGTPLHLFPAANGVQHCEIAGMHDTLEDLATMRLDYSEHARVVAGERWEQAHSAIRFVRPMANCPCRKPYPVGG